MDSADTRIQSYPGGDYSTEIPQISFAGFMLKKMKEHGDEIACIDSETKRSLTYSQVIDTTVSLAAGLQTKLNLKMKDIVAIALPNCLDYPMIGMAINLAGATTTLFNPAQTISELRHCTKLTNPRIWIVTENYVNKFFELFPDTANQPQLILLEPKTGYISVPDLISIGLNSQFTEPSTANPLDDVAFILFSSGTTGPPKGVVQTNFNYVAARSQNLITSRNSPRNPAFTSIVLLPLFHTAGFHGPYVNLLQGLKYVLLSKFSLHNLLSAIQEFKVTTMVLVPAIAVQIAKQPVEKQYDLSSLRVVVSSTAAIGKDIIVTLRQKLNCFIIQSYGMTEVTLATHGNTFAFNREGSIGVVLPFNQSKVVDVKTNETLGPNQEGEICVKGAMVMKEYLNNEEATKNTIDAEGWLHTGDLGYYDADGFFFITDRLKELIKYKGYQVAPSELEQIILTHSEVLDAAVGSIPDESAGELPRAYVVKRPGSILKEADIIEYVEERVSAYKRLRGGVVFINQVPKTASGKILRRELKKITSQL